MALSIGFITVFLWKTSTKKNIAMVKTTIACVGLADVGASYVEK